MFIVTGKLVLQVLTDLKTAHTYSIKKKSPHKNQEEIVTEVKKNVFINFIKEVCVD